MGSIVPIRRATKLNNKNFDASNISFDTGIKNLLVSRQDSMNTDNLSKNSSKNKLFGFLKMCLPHRKKPINLSFKSLSLQNKQSRLAELNDTIKNIENAFQPKKARKVDQKKTFFQTDLIKTDVDMNKASRKRNSLFPTFLRKITDYKKHKTGLNVDDLNLFNILKNYFKSQKIKIEPNRENSLKLGYELKKNKATNEYLTNLKKETLDYYVDEFLLPERSNKNADPDTPMAKSPKKSTAIIANNNIPSKILFEENHRDKNSMILDAAFAGLNLTKKQSILKKNFRGPLGKSFSPMNRPFKDNENNEENNGESPQNNNSPYKSSSNTPNHNSFNIPLTNMGSLLPVMNSSKKNTPQQSPSNSPKHAKFNKIVLNKCILPLRFKTSLKITEPIKSNIPIIDMKRRKSCFNEDNNKKTINNNLSIMAPINEEEGSPRNKNYRTQISIGSNENEEPTPKENKDCETFNLEQSPNFKNQARIVKYGKWTFSNFSQEQDLRKKHSKSIISSTLQIDRSTLGTPPARKVVRAGKCYNILRKNDNLIIRNNKALQIVEENSEFLERMRKRKWFDGLDNLGKIAVKNLSPTAFYFCRNRDEQKKMLSFEE